MLDQHYLDLLDELSKLIAELEQDPAHEHVIALLHHIDLVHREGLLRLVDALRTHDAGPLLERIVQEDSVVRILLGLYGLADLNLPPETDTPNFVPIERLFVRRSGS
ncbi:MAG TPA: hypothetical protein VE714_12830 [Gemmatimonadales bacterium]|jgi:hypothetical protein|nr:hypothetical protein [Gemmatimonadales bacterium]